MNAPSDIMSRIEALAAISESPAHLTRRYLTDEHQRVNALVGEWMKAAGMTTRVDAVGNVIGRYEAVQPNAAALVMGSHLDTVANAGRYDGMLGVLTPIACVEELSRNGERFDFAIEIVGFADEEGLRFQSTLLGSRGIAGTFELPLLDRVDADGLRMRDAMRDFGLDPDRINEAARRPEELVAYVELHIEQGPVLEDNNLPVGVVSAIAGATRLEVRLVGVAGHAGTVPMGLRRDALGAAAEMVGAIEAIAVSDPELVATVGRFEVAPGAVNVIPGEVLFSLDVRSGTDTRRESAVAEMRETIARIADQRKIEVSITQTHENSGCRCAPWLVTQLEKACADEGITPMTLPSGAGHDAMAVADIADVGMLFVRCDGGISHNPDEDITGEDAETGRRTLLRFIRNFQANPSPVGYRTTATT